MEMDKETVLEKIKENAKQYFAATKHTFVPGKTRIGVGSPIYNEDEVTAVMNALLETNISQGKAVKNFETLFANYIGVKHAVATNSGSSANLMALTAFMERGEAKPGDEIIMPAATFSTVAFPAIQVGLVPVFVDVDDKSYNINPDEIKKAISEKTKILMPVHSIGNPCDIGKIKKISDKHDFRILEDCCEAHGASINGRKVGSYGDMATLSFYVAHNITTGEGGMIFTNSDDYEEMLRSIREFGRKKQEKERYVKVDKLGTYDVKYVFERLGYNLRMTDLQASFGIEQFKKLDKFNKTRIEIVDYFNKELKEYGNLIQLPKASPGAVHTYYGYLLAVRQDAPFTRQDIVNYLEQNQIETRAFFGGCLPDQPALHNKNIRVVGNLPVSRWLRDNAFFIGCHPGIGEEERKYVMEKFHSFLKKF